MRYGEIVELGQHKLMCGDATNKDDVMKLIGDCHVDLVLTDPPYGMKCQDNDGTVGGGSVLCMREYRIAPESIVPAQKYPQLIGDNSQDTAKRHYKIIKDLTEKQIIWGGQYFAHFLPVSGGWLFWDKQTGNNDFSDGELAWRSWGKKVTKYIHIWNGLVREGSWSLNPKPRIHPTQKPVELHMRILEDFSKPDDVILDCFGGSGTTLIACEVSGRKCLMMEISPDYCDIIRERYEKVKDIAPLFKELKE